MAAAASTKNLIGQIETDLLKCPICCSRYVNPHVLNCQHTFCLRCIKGCLENSSEPRNTLKCAVCRKVTKLGKEGVSSLSKNLTVSQLMQVVKKTSGDKRAASGGRTSNNNTRKPQSRKSGGRGTTVKTSNRSNASRRCNDPESEYRRVYRREYTPCNSSDSSDFTSSSDDCCACGRRRRCDCSYSSSLDSSILNSSSSSYDSTSYESCDKMSPEMRRVTIRSGRGGGRRSRGGGCCGGRMRRGRGQGSCRR